MTNRLFVQTNNPAGNQILVHKRPRTAPSHLLRPSIPVGSVAGMTGQVLIPLPLRARSSTTRTTVC
jgi:hypothetical protein